MTRQSLSDLLERLATLVPVRKPAPQAEIHAVEQRLGIRISDDFAFVYERLNGTTEPTLPENGWFQLWRLDQWYTVEEYVRDWPERDRQAFRQISSAVVFADYSLESYHFAARFSGTSREQASPIFALTIKPYLVTESLGAFLASALVDGAEMYPQD